MDAPNGSTAKLAAAFQDVIDEALEPVKSDVATLKTDMKQVLEILTGGRP